jgi:hypothetical protein
VDEFNAVAPLAGSCGSLGGAGIGDSWACLLLGVFEVGEVVKCGDDARLFCNLYAAD